MSASGDITSAHQGPAAEHRASVVDVSFAPLLTDFVTALSKESVNTWRNGALLRWQTADSEKLIRNSLRARAVHDPSGRCIAFAAAVPELTWPGSLEITVVVADEHRRQGLGRVLLRALEHDTRGCSAGRWHAHIGAYNVAARQLFYTHGFTWDATRRLWCKSAAPGAPRRLRRLIEMGRVVVALQHEWAS